MQVAKNQTDQHPIFGNQLLRVSHVLLNLLIIPLQSTIMYAAIMVGLGYAYVLLWVLGMHVFAWLHYYKVQKDRKLNWINPLFDYLGLAVFWLFLPLGLSISAVNIIPLHQAEIAEFVARHIDFVRWIVSLELLNVPTQKYLQLDNQEHVILIYSYTLVVLAGVVGAVLSMPLWWIMAKGWFFLYKSMPMWRRVLIFTFFCFLIWLINSEPLPSINYGFRPFVVEKAGQKIMAYRTSDALAIRSIFHWSGYMITQSVLMSGVLGFIRYQCLKSTEKGDKNA